MKMRFWIALIIVSALFLGCRSKHKIVEIFEKDNKELVKADSVKEIKTDSVATKEVKRISDNKSYIKEDSGKIEIIGKSDIDTPFVYYNINGSDTLQSISINGKATFKIKNSWNNKKNETKERLFEESLNAVAKYSREAVAKETIKKSSEKIKEVSKTVEETGGTFGAYIVYILWFAAIVCMVGLVYYFRGGINIKGILNKIINK